MALPDTAHLDPRFPAIADLRARARRRIPHFAWEYLDSGTGAETALRRNREALDRIRFTPSILHGDFSPDLSTKLLGRDYPLPLGIAPVGMSGMLWPGAERHLARLAAAAQIPYCLSTVASRTPEEIGPEAGGQGWFQLYPPRDPEMRADLLRRARDAGFHTLILTADVPVAARRERQIRGGLTNPPRLSPRILAQIARCPAWALGTLRTGLPRLRTLDPYSENRTVMPSTQHIGYILRTSPDWTYLKELRALWKGAFVVKGVLVPEDAKKLKAEGVDAVWVSNHAGRQFDGVPPAIDALPAIREAVGPKYPLIFDSGVASGLDVLRALALGADFVMLGRAPHYGLGALGPIGAAHALHILKADMISAMGQLGAKTFADLAARLVA